MPQTKTTKSRETKTTRNTSTNKKGEKVVVTKTVTTYRGNQYLIKKLQGQLFFIC